MQIIESKESLIAFPGDGWLYYSSPGGDIHRSRPDGSGDTLILKADKLPNHLVEKDDYYNYAIDIIGEVIYLKAQVWGIRGNRGWRDTLVSHSFSRIHVDGTGFQTLSRILD